MKMKVLLVNGSPHGEGCTYTALKEVAGALESNGIDTHIYHITNPVFGCIACEKCREAGRCVIGDDAYNELSKLCIEADGIVLGSPVYFAGPNGTLCALLDRIFFSIGRKLMYKPGAAVVSCRRGGASSTFDRLNKYFTISQDARCIFAVLEFRARLYAGTCEKGSGGHADNADARHKYGMAPEMHQSRRRPRFPSTNRTPLRAFTTGYK